MTVSRSIYVAADGIISFFYDWVIFYCIYVHFHTSFCVWECIICIMNSPCIHGFLRYTLSIYDCYSKLVHSMISDVNFLLSVILTRLLTYCLLIIYLFQYQNLCRNSSGTKVEHPSAQADWWPEGNTMIIFILSYWDVHRMSTCTLHLLK